MNQRLNKSVRGLIAASMIFTVSSVVVTMTGIGRAAAVAPLSNGSLSMVSTRADGTSGPAFSNSVGAEQESISDDGKVIAFVSDVAPDQLVSDPLQVGHVGSTSGTLNVYVWDSRLPAPAGPIVTLVSWNNSHTGAGDANSQHPVMAPSGLGVVFDSSADDLVTVPVGSHSLHLYAWLPAISDLTPLFMVDENYEGTGGSDSVSSEPSVAIGLTPPSARVAFMSSGTDLVDPTQHKAENGSQVFVRTYTLATPSTQMVSVISDGTNGTPSGAEDPMISADANHVVFESGGSDLVAGVNATGGDIFERNLLTDTTKLVSVNTGGTQGTGGSNSPVVSADGSAVAWDSNATDASLIPSNGDAHIFYRLGSAPVVMVDTNSTGLSGCNEASNIPGVSLDGTMVDFESFCTDITPPSMTASGTQVYARRMVPDPSVPALADAVPQLISVNQSGTGSGNGDAMLCDGGEPPYCGATINPGKTMNANGTAITFFSASSDIAPVPNPPPPNAGTANIFVRYPDVPNGGLTANLTANILGQNGDGDSEDPVISSDGGSVAFDSAADDLVPNDNNETSDVFESNIHNSFVMTPVTVVNESAGSVTIAVLRTGNDGTTDTVEVKTGDGSTPDIPLLPPQITNPANSNAVAGTDYTAIDKTLTFPPGATTESFSVPITNNTPAENPKLFHVSLSNSSGAGASQLPGPASEAYVVIIDDNDPPQTWSVTPDQQPPASAVVGDDVTTSATISVATGADALVVNSLSSGAGTSGLDSVAFPETTPLTIAPGTSEQITATARVVASPGTTGTKLDIAVDGNLGTAESVQDAVTNDIASTEAVTGAITGQPPAAGLADQFTYQLDLANASDTAAQIDVPAGDLTAPTGADLVSEVNGDTTIAAHSTSVYQVTVSVDGADTDGTTITEAPTGITYAMSDISLASRAVSVASVTTNVDAPVVSVTAHTLTDVNGATLDPNDVVNVSETVHNSGSASTVATLTDNLTNLTSPTNIEIDGAPCGACTSTTSSVTAPLGTVAASGTDAVTFSATVPASPTGTKVTSSATVSFTPAITGASPTAADATSLTIGSTNVQGWHLAVTQEPPGSAVVGDTVSLQAQLTVDPGSNSLDVTDLSSGQDTVGLDQVNFADTTPFVVAAGTSHTLDLTARLDAAPGTSGVLADVSATGALGATTSTNTADSSDIASTGALSASLSGGSATVAPGDQITYTLTFDNSSATPAQLSGLPAALTAPAGTTTSTPTSGSTTVPANGSTSWTLVTSVDGADTTGTTLTETPGSVSYGMSAIGLSGQSVTFVPSSVSSTVHVPPGPATHFTITGLPANTIPGVAHHVTVTALDSLDVTSSGYTGTIHFTSSDGHAVLPADATLTAGVGTFSVVLNSAGPQTVTATDTVNSGLSGTSAPVTVAGPPSAPKGLSAKTVATGIQLAWAAPASNGGAPVTSYTVLRGLSSGGESASPIAITSAPTFIDMSVIAGVRYFYKVAARNAAGTSVASNEASAVTVPSPPAGHSAAGGHRFTGTPDGQGGWLVSPGGQVTAFGDATNFGSVTGPITQPIVAMAVTPSGHGYWLVAANGQIYPFGDAHFYGSTGNIKLNQPIVGIAPTADGKGYWLVAADGGVFTFGDAHFYGSTGNITLNQPVVGIALTADGKGYWLVAADGGVFTFGDGRFHGSLGGTPLARPIIGMIVDQSGAAYTLVDSGGDRTHL